MEDKSETCKNAQTLDILSPKRKHYHYLSGLVSFGMGIMRPERIPLFPLNVVLLPGASLPLHIFEPRYKEMVKACLEEKTEFGMLLALPKGVAKVGCTAEILEVVKR